MTLRLQEEQKLMINSGTMYGPGGEGFIRLNIACPRTLLVEGLERMAVCWNKMKNKPAMR